MKYYLECAAVNYICFNITSIWPVFIWQSLWVTCLSHTSGVWVKVMNLRCQTHWGGCCGRWYNGSWRLLPPAALQRSHSLTSLCCFIAGSGLCLLFYFSKSTKADLKTRQSLTLYVRHIKKAVPSMASNWLNLSAKQQASKVLRATFCCWLWF